MRSAVLLGALLLTTAGCGGSDSPAAPTPVPIRPNTLTLDGTAAFTDRAQVAQWTATITLTNGAVQDQTRAALWRSSNPAVASVSATGLVTSVGSGATQISASFEGVSAVRAANVTIACQINNTAVVRFANGSRATTHTIIWDGSVVFTLSPGQTSDPLTAAAGIAHALLFRIAGSSTLACSSSAPILSQCSTQTYFCDFP